MSRRYATDLDMQKNKLENASIQPLAAAPTSPVEGQIYFDTTTKRLMQYDGSVWIAYGTSSDSDAHLEVPFTMQSSITVTHNLGKIPSVQVIDTSGDEVVGDTSHANVNELTVFFSAPFSGKIYLN